MNWIAILALAAQDVDSLIEKLGDDDPRAREEAAREIVRIGKPALDALRKTEGSSDPEIAQRAAALIDQIDWPDAGPASNGLSLAIKPKKSYTLKEPVILRARLTNVSEGDVTLSGGYAFLLALDDREELGHPACMGRDRAEPFPTVAEPLTLKKGETVEFAFSPRAWCRANEHSKTGPVVVAQGEHRLRLTLNGTSSAKGVWRGRVESNQVKVAVRD
jgi:hypothetical protein